MTENSGSAVAHDQERSRFSIDVDGEPAVADYTQEGDTIMLTHTVVPRSARGQGIGDELAKAAFEYARSNDLKVVPVCPFMRTFADRHDEYTDLLKRT